MNASGAGALGKAEKYARTQKKRRVCARCVFSGRLSTRQRLCMTFWLGGVGYGLLELIWRGETHWSMVLTGGACLALICAVNKWLKKKNIFLRAAVCAAAVTAVEFAVGMVVNCLLGMGVWDYSGMFGNIMGQICPLYSFLWFLLCVPICFAAGKRAH